MDRARSFLAHLGPWPRRSLIQHRALSAIIFGVVAHAFETPLRIGSGAATFDACGWRIFGRVLHLASLRRTVSKPATPLGEITKSVRDLSHSLCVAWVTAETQTGKRKLKRITMAQAKLSDGQELLAVNDIFVGAKSHVSARYELHLGEHVETHSSSGVIVSTELGSTGWFRSLLTGVVGISGPVAPLVEATCVQWISVPECRRERTRMAAFLTSEPAHAQQGIPA